MSERGKERGRESETDTTAYNMERKCYKYKERAQF